MGQDPERLETFQRGMKGLDVMVPCVGHFDFGVLAASEEEEEEVVELVDVGGGHGAVLKQILDAHPQLNPERIVLQDYREDVVELARAGQRNGTGLPRGVRVMVHDVMGQSVRGTFHICIQTVKASFWLLDSLTNIVRAVRCKSILHANDLSPSLRRCGYSDALSVG